PAPAGPGPPPPPRAASPDGAQQPAPRRAARRALSRGAFRRAARCAQCRAASRTSSRAGALARSSGLRRVETGLRGCPRLALLLVALLLLRALPLGRIRVRLRADVRGQREDQDRAQRENDGSLHRSLNARRRPPSDGARTASRATVGSARSSAAAGTGSGPDAGGHASAHPP